MCDAENLMDTCLLTVVVEAGGFSAAARLTGTTRSRLSRRIIELEGRLQTTDAFDDIPPLPLYTLTLRSVATSQATQDLVQLIRKYLSETRPPGVESLRDMSWRSFAADFLAPQVTANSTFASRPAASDAQAGLAM